MKHSQILACVALVAFLACCAGCGPNDGLNEVTGMVTLDGQPVENGNINMGPMAGQSGVGVGGPITNGLYKIRASEGEMVVNIRWPKMEKIDNPTADEQAHGVTERQIEMIPSKYNRESTLKVTVQKGKNTFDFDLKSGDE